MDPGLLTLDGFAEDGKMLALASIGRIVRLWDQSRGVCRHSRAIQIGGNHFHEG